MVDASNCAVGQAFEDRAEYWYRTNDDTKFMTANWIRDFNSLLASQEPPNLGPYLP